MKTFELLKWVGEGLNAEPSEFVLKGTLLEIVNHAEVNGFNWHELPNHLVGGYYTKPIDDHTADAYEVVPA